MRRISLRFNHKIVAIAVVGVAGVALMGAIHMYGESTMSVYRNQAGSAGRIARQVSANITDVQRGASETGSASAQVLSSAQSLSGESICLKLEVGKFFTSVRAA